MPTGDPILDGALITSLVGVASVGVFTLSSCFAHAMRFASGCLLPLVFVQLGQSGPTPPLIAGGLLIYICILWFEVAQAEARLVELLGLRFEKCHDRRREVASPAPRRAFERRKEPTPGHRQT